MLSMDTGFSSGRSTPLNWDDCDESATCDEVTLLDDDDDDELQSLQVSGVSRMAFCKNLATNLFRVFFARTPLPSFTTCLECLCTVCVCVTSTVVHTFTFTIGGI